MIKSIHTYGAYYMCRGGGGHEFVLYIRMVHTTCVGGEGDMSLCCTYVWCILHV